MLGKSEKETDLKILKTSHMGYYFICIVKIMTKMD
jgi:hypothetical protein